MGRAAEAELRVHNPDIRFERVALYPSQVEDYALPTRLGKRTDSR